MRALPREMAENIAADERLSRWLAARYQPADQDELQAYLLRLMAAADEKCAALCSRKLAPTIETLRAKAAALRERADEIAPRTAETPSVNHSSSRPA